MRQAQALLARAGFDPHRVLDMTMPEIESHLANLRKITGQQPAGGSSNTRRFKGSRKKKT